MKKVNWWIDPFMIPVVIVGFLIGYVWISFVAGVDLAEYTFDPDSFCRRCGVKGIDKKSIQ